MPLRSLLAGAAGLSTTATAWAHEGHGAFGGWHWHASDTVGLFVVGVLATLAWWLSARGGE